MGWKLAPWVLGVGIAVGCVGLFFWQMSSRALPTAEVLFPDETVVTVEVASDLPSQVRGLSGRATLGENRGMLFVYDAAGLPGIWMNEMNFSIDILWLMDGRIVHIVERAPTPVEGKPLEVYKPEFYANAVLELPAGFVQAHGVQFGDELTLRE